MYEKLILFDYITFANIIQQIIYTIYNSMNNNDETVKNQLAAEISNLIDAKCKSPNEKAQLIAFLKEKYGDQEEENEVLLNKDNFKFTAFPIKYQNIWRSYKEQMACFWKPEELDFSNDYSDFLTLNKDEQHFIEMILAFFAASDGIVNFNISERFLKDIKVTEALFTYQFQMMMENIHSEVYSLMLDNIVKDAVKKEFLFNAIKNVPAVKKMADWAFKWIHSSERFAYRLVAFAIVEGVFFSGAFASIFWLKKYKQKGEHDTKAKPFMNGLVTSNKFIARDEGLHCTFASILYEYVKKLSKEEIDPIMIEAVEIAKQFMTDAIPVRLIGMNNDLMCTYIEYVADRLFEMLGHKKIYNKKNPFKFMETIGLNDKTNFFELRPHEYQDAHVLNKSKKEVVINDDF
jgi:ribonucleotide reductase beta subunit family protein with ferritin-like domain